MEYWMRHSDEFLGFFLIGVICLLLYLAWLIRWGAPQ